MFISFDLVLSLPSRAQRLHSIFSGLQLEYSRYALVPSQALSSSPFCFVEERTWSKVDDKNEQLEYERVAPIRAHSPVKIIEPY